MSSYNFTPIALGAAADANTFNAPMGQLDEGMGNIDNLTTDAADLTAAVNEVHALISTTVDAEAYIRALADIAESVARVAADDTLDARIDNLLIASGDTDAEVQDARLAINYGNSGDPTVLEETIEWGAANVYNVLAYGASAGAAASVNDVAFEAAINAANSAGGGVVFVPEGTYLVDSITLKSHVCLRGDGVNRTFLQKTSSTPTGSIGMIDIDITDADIENITIENLYFSQPEDVSSRCIWFNTSGTAPVGVIKNVTIRNCYFVSAANINAHLIQFGQSTPQGARVQNVRILDCYFKGYDNPGGQQFLLYLNHGEEFNDVDSSIYIERCHFEDGYIALKCDGTGAGPNIVFQNNHVHGQNFQGAIFYHCLNVRCLNNVFSEIVNPAEGGTDSGIIYLDTRTATTSWRGGLCCFNVIRASTGNGIYAEDFVGGTIGFNHVLSLAERASTYTSGTGNTSDGGHGILIAAGCAGALVIGNRVNTCEGNGILLARDLAPDGVYGSENLGSVRIIGNYLLNNVGNGIEMDAEFLAMSGNYIISDNVISGPGTAGKAGIRTITATGISISGTLQIHNNFITGYPNGYDHVGATNYAINMTGNTINATSAAIDNSGLTGGLVVANRIVAGTVSLGTSVQIAANSGLSGERFTLSGDFFRIATAKTPASAAATGTQGQIAWDSGFLYVCTATDTWKRVAIATW